MSVPVDIYITDESSSPIPMPNVEVGIYAVNSHNLVAQATSDVNGVASFMLPGVTGAGTPYEVRFFKLGVNFHGLRVIAVVEPPLSGAPNKFDHTGTDSNILPVSGSPFLCRCTGVFVDFRGQALVNKNIRFMSKADNICKTPKVTNSTMVTPDEMEFRTDSNGRLSVDLIRTGQYFVTWGGDDDTVWCITVPDRFSANLIELIHPFPVLLDWDDTLAPGDAVALAVQGSATIPVEVTFSDYKTTNQGLETYFTLECSDPLVFSFSWSTGVVSITGLAPGTATLTPVLRTDILPNRWPVPTPIMPPLTITVT